MRECEMLWGCVVRCGTCETLWVGVRCCGLA